MRRECNYEVGRESQMANSTPIHFLCTIVAFAIISIRERNMSRIKRIAKESISSSTLLSLRKTSYAVALHLSYVPTPGSMNFTQEMSLVLLCMKHHIPTISKIWTIQM
ncbi:hypothetical protein BDZ45DRAFT_117008 [Acephala macrosclerotiorum]|nr:hypothetical protein BDZ45DRAFT_117008 [Acephala macrosclerotiorum]